MLNCLLLNGARPWCGCGFSLVRGLLQTKLFLDLSQTRLNGYKTAGNAHVISYGCLFKTFIYDKKLMMSHIVDSYIILRTMPRKSV
jgi:hypothetical protein